MATVNSIFTVWTEGHIPTTLEAVHTECTCDAEEDVNAAARTDPAAQGGGGLGLTSLPRAPPSTTPQTPGASPSWDSSQSPGLRKAGGGGDRAAGDPEAKQRHSPCDQEAVTALTAGGGRTVRKTTCQTSGQRAAHRPTRAARRPPALGRGHAPFLRLIDDVADLHVQCPVLTLQGAVCSLFCKFRKKTGLHFSWNKDPGREEEGPGPTPLSHQADGLSRQHLWVLLPREYLGGGPGADS